MLHVPTFQTASVVIRWLKGFVSSDSVEGFFNDLVVQIWGNLNPAVGFDADVQFQVAQVAQV